MNLTIECYRFGSENKFKVDGTEFISGEGLIDYCREHYSNGSRPSGISGTCMGMIPSEEQKNFHAWMRGEFCPRIMN